MVIKMSFIVILDYWLNLQPLLIFHKASSIEENHKGLEQCVGWILSAGKNLFRANYKKTEEALVGFS